MLPSAGVLGANAALCCFQATTAALPIQLPSEKLTSSCFYPTPPPAPPAGQRTAGQPSTSAPGADKKKRQREPSSEGEDDGQGHEGHAADKQRDGQHGGGKHKHGEPRDGQAAGKGGKGHHAHGAKPMSRLQRLAAEVKAKKEEERLAREQVGLYHCIRG